MAQCRLEATRCKQKALRVQGGTSELGWGLGTSGGL